MIEGMPLGIVATHDEDPAIGEASGRVALALEQQGGRRFELARRGIVSLSIGQSVSLGSHATHDEDLSICQRGHGVRRSALAHLGFGY
ncbi:MAG: hypothetical protein RhofKO_12340 [Rhodothermales bacterium]